MKFPFVLRSTLDKTIEDCLTTVRATKQGYEDRTRLDIRQALDAAKEANVRFDGLLERYHDLATRPTTPEIPTQAPILSAASALGPKARSALAAMGAGQARDTRDAMQAEALRLQAADATDENIAKAIYQGEKVL